MPEFVTLSCLLCYAKLQIGNDIQQFVCSRCGSEYVVKRNGNVISLTPVAVAEQLKGVLIGVDKTASELAIVRLKREIEILKNAQREVEGIQRMYQYSKSSSHYSDDKETLLLEMMDHFLEKIDHRQPTKSFLIFWKVGFPEDECNKRWYSLSIDESKIFLSIVREKHRLAQGGGYGSRDRWKDTIYDLERLIVSREKILELPQRQRELEKHLKIVES